MGTTGWPAGIQSAACGAVPLPTLHSLRPLPLQTHLLHPQAAQASVHSFRSQCACVALTPARLFGSLRLGAVPMRYCIRRARLAAEFASKCTSCPIPPPTLRERLSTAAGAGVFGELVGAALVRELHVYGQLIPTKPAIAETSAGVSDPQQSQHVGFGTRMMLRAEAIALEHGFRRMAVISGVGAQSWRRYGKVDRLWRSTAGHA